MSTFETDDQPAFAPTLHSILDRYRHAAVDRLNAVKALTGITLALAPDELFDAEGEAQLNVYFEAQLDHYRAAEEAASEALRDAIVAFVWAAAQGHGHVRQRLDGGLDGAESLGL